MKFAFFISLALFFAPPSFGQTMSTSSCSDMEVWDLSMGMCMPLPMKDMPMRMLMVQGNAFAVQSIESGPRGRSALSSPNMIMADLGSSLGDSHYVNLDFMGTFELWTFPDEGYPELLQIGEEQKNGAPFLDAQHPHNSPIMGLTLSDTIRLNDDSKDHLKLHFSPRGESGDGPIAFMHRPTGMANPDAPLGHHIAQDVGHISSTVFGASLRLSDWTLEASAFDGEEPNPTSTGLSLGTPNSYSFRLARAFTPSLTAMTSVAYVKSPEHDDPNLPFVLRYSASVYTEGKLGDCALHTASIVGLILKYDHADTLFSFGEEFLLEKNRSLIFGRIEALQRTPDELEVPSSGSPNDGQWIGAITGGYTHRIFQSVSDAPNAFHLSLGGSATMDLLPSSFAEAYGSRTPWTGKLFLRIDGLGMWDL